MAKYRREASTIISKTLSAHGRGDIQLASRALSLDTPPASSRQRATGINVRDDTEFFDRCVVFLPAKIGGSENINCRPIVAWRPMLPLKHQRDKLHAINSRAAALSRRMPGIFRL